MGEYLSPGVYTEDLSSNSVIIEGVATSIAGFVGVSKRGDASAPVYITSWTDFKKKFAYGMDSPFYKNSYLAFEVYSFFNNQGTKCYIQRVGTSKLAKASAKVMDSTNTSTVLLNLSAKDEGAWGNSLKVKCTANADVATSFDVTVTYGTDSEVFEQLVNDESDEKYFLDYINMNSNYIKVLSGDKISVFAEVSFTGGDDGEDGVTDNDYLTALSKFDGVDDCTLICVPGQTSDAMLTGICDYIDNHKYQFAALDAPMAFTTTEIKALRKKLSCKRAVLLDTWHKINDPLSNVNGKYRSIPSSGAYLGVAARTVESIGPWKAPAGTDAKLNGAIELVFSAQKGDTDILNPAGVVSIINKANYGNIVWGARCITPNSQYKYVSDVLLDIYIKKSVEEGTQSLVFDPNKTTLWNKIIVSCESFLDKLWRDGGLKGDTAKEAYYVKCDKELNPDEVTDLGECITEIGYASAKPAEFIVFRFTNKVPTSA
jgi:phage tail sheath protein FI